MTRAATAADPGALMTCAQMYAVDKAAMTGGPGWDPVPGLALMDKAGRAVAEAVRARYPLARHPRIVVLCGPGNNGGDGFVAARYLDAWGYRVRVFGVAGREALKGDAAAMAARWRGTLAPLEVCAIEPGDVVIDALFGAGLTRPLEGTPADLARRCADKGAHVVSVDIPSGYSGDTGQGGGQPFAADLTVTFHAKKLGHGLTPARFACGELVVADIGIPAAAARSVVVEASETVEALVAAGWPKPDAAAHKYGRGHTVVLSGRASATGAARLAARAALRVGSGLVTVASPPGAVLVNASQLTAVMVRSVADADGLAALLEDTRLNAVVLGPGMGVGEETAASVEAALAGTAAVVLDADAITSFEAEPERLANALAAHRKRGGQAVLTPHDGEFARLTGAALDPAERVEAVREAAGRFAATVLLKGPSTLVADAEGPVAVNTNAPAWLATAGSGDVLAGLVGGLLAQGLPAFEAAAFGAFAHGAAGAHAGPGLIAEDLCEHLPHVLRRFG